MSPTGFLSVDRAPFLLVEPVATTPQVRDPSSVLNPTTALVHHMPMIKRDIGKSEHVRAVSTELGALVAVLLT